MCKAVSRWAISSLLAIALAGCATYPPGAYECQQGVQPGPGYYPTQQRTMQTYNTSAQAGTTYAVFQKNGTIYGFNQKSGQLHEFNGIVWDIKGQPIER